MKKTMCIIMCVCFLLAISSTAFAASEVDDSLTTAQNNTFTFTDSEGKTNKLIASYENGTTHVEHYINNELINIAETQLIDNNHISVSFTDFTNNSTTVSVESISDFLVDSERITIPSYETQAYRLTGRINYKTTYGSMGDFFAGQYNGVSSYTYC